VINGSDLNQSELRLGLNTDRSFDYGEIPVGVTVTKKFDVNTTTDVLLRLKVTGNITEKIHYQESYYFNGSQQVPVTFNSTETGNYSGELRLITEKPANSVGETWLDFKSSLYS
jgi:hypothetical protein